MSKWSHLPNAKHIDWVLASMKENPKVWDEAQTAAHAAAWTEAQVAARTAAWYEAYDAAQSSAYIAGWNEAYDAVLNVIRDEKHGKVPSVIYDVIMALVTYDHCKKYLRMTPDELLVWWKLSEDPACVLLMPMVKVLHGEKHG